GCIALYIRCQMLTLRPSVVYSEQKGPADLVHRQAHRCDRHPAWLEVVARTTSGGISASVAPHAPSWGRTQRSSGVAASAHARRPRKGARSRASSLSIRPGSAPVLEHAVPRGAAHVGLARGLNYLDLESR